MLEFYNVMGVLRCIFSIVLIVYQLYRYYANIEMPSFQIMIIWMIQCLTLLQACYSFYWNYRVFISCEFWSRLVSAFIDINMFTIGVLITYYLYQTVDMIYKFS